MALSYVDHVGDGATTPFSIPFPYLKEAHITVTIDDVVQVNGVDYFFSNPSQITFNVAPILNAAIRFQRFTSPNTRLVNYQTPDALTEQDLDTDSLQAFYLCQEANDVAAEAEAIVKTETGKAADSAAAAAVSETNAANSASAAAASETNAAASASSIVGDAAAAAASASAASTSETNAAASETAAAGSATAASTSETNAAASETLAQDWATKTPGFVEGMEFSAKKHAQDAAGSASAAAGSATSASNAAGVANTAASNASQSETNASASASAASSSATAAGTSETNAAGSASAAATSASNAGASETAAATSETNAAQSATDALTFGVLFTTSPSNVTIGLGSRSFTTADVRAFQVGMFVKVSASAAPTVNWMFGQVTSWTPGTRVLVVDVTRTNGSGTINAWDVHVSGAAGVDGVDGQDGADGAQGAPGADGAPGQDGANGINLVPQGPYSSLISYSIDEVTTFDGSAWRSLQDNNLNNTPNTSPTFWELFVSKGDQGAQGIQGNQGIQGEQGIQGIQGETGQTGATGPTGLAGVRTETASYTPVLADRDYLIIMNSASALNFTVPSNSSVAYPVGATLHVKQGGVGQVTIVDGAGVTVDTPATLTKRLKEQNSVVTLMKEATDTWSLIGHQETVA